MSKPVLGEEYYHQATVEIFPQANPWVYISVPNTYVKLLAEFMDRGLVAVTATVGSSTWNTSLMPKGDCTLFIPLSNTVRKKENIEVGDTINNSFKLRNRHA